MFNLGAAHEHGVGLPKDLHLAKRYYDMVLSTNPKAFLPVRLALWKLAAHAKVVKRQLERWGWIASASAGAGAGAGATEKRRRVLGGGERRGRRGEGRERRARAARSVGFGFWFGFGGALGARRRPERHADLALAGAGWRRRAVVAARLVVQAL